MSPGSWKVVLAFTGVFLAGAVAGGFVSVRVAKAAALKRGEEGFVASQTRRLTGALDLTPEQCEKIKPIVDAAGEEVHRLRRETTQIFQRMGADIARELTPEQKEKFAELQQKQRERWRKMMEAREKRRELERTKAKAEDEGPATPPEKDERAPPPDEPKP